MTGPAARLSWAANSWPIEADPRCEFYIERLKAFPSYCASILADGVSPRQAQFVSRPVLEAFITQADALAEAHRSGSGSLLQPLQSARKRGHDCAQVPADLPEIVLSALFELRSLAKSLLPSAHRSSPWPFSDEGSRRYAEAIYAGTSLHLSPDALERLGASTLEDSQLRFTHLLDSGLANFDTPQTSAELLARFEAVHAKLVTGVSAVCSSRPSMQCQIAAMPDAHSVVGPAAYYYPSSQRNNRQGTVYVNATEPILIRNCEVLPLAMHEGLPGHHLQLALLDENESLPVLLRLLFVNAFTEGWAVYAETLAQHLGIELTPSEEFGLISHRRWRAARLVVDVGLHARGWSVEQATKFLAESTGQEGRAVEREIVRYIAWPGQALGYLVGANVVADWVRDRLTDGLPLPDAHASLLALGSVPLSQLTGSS